MLGTPPLAGRRFFGEGQVVVVLESMKMEMEVTAPCDGIVAEILCQQGRSVQGGQRLLVLATEGA